MIVAKGKPEFDDETPCYVYDIWEGANFRLRIKKVDKYPNYDSSAFDSPTELFDGDEERQEEVLSQCYKLAEFLEPSNFKSYEELQKRFEGVVNASSVRPAAADVDNENRAPARSQKQSNSLIEDDGDDNPFNSQPAKESKPAQKKAADPAPDLGGGDDDNLDEFKALLDSI